MRGTLKVAAVKAPGYSDRRKAILEDMAILIAGRAITEDLGIKLENLTLGDLRRATKITIDDHTTIIEGAGTKQRIDGRVQTDSRADRRHDDVGLGPRRASMP